MNSAVKRWLGLVLPPLLVLAAVTGAAEVVVRMGWVRPFVLPAPSMVFDVFFPAAADPDKLEQAVLVRNSLFQGLWGTARGALGGLGLSLLVGTAAAVAMASASWIRRALYPYAVFFQTVPIIAIAPMLVIWIGYDLRVVIATSFIASVFPVIANTLTGLRSTDPQLREMFKLYGAGVFATVFKLRIPCALPSMLTGYRIAGGLAVVGAIVGEFISIGGSDSLGSVIDAARTMQRTDVVFAAVLLASLLGLAIFGAINLTAHLLLRHWHASEM